MTGNPCWQVIPTKLSLEQFEQFAAIRHFESLTG
jgi:hypothetical protein